MSKNGYPQLALDSMEPSAAQDIVGSLLELHTLGKPKSDAEVKERIDKYFLFCQQSSIRPGIESLCMALCVTRTTLFNWNNGIGCTPERQQYIQSAKSFIGAFIEQAVLCGKISPPSGIFLMKNWLGYKDLLSLEDSVPNKPERRIMLMDELPKLGELPNLEEKEEVNI